jgi:hypothetical protein
VAVKKLVLSGLTSTTTFWVAAIQCFDENGLYIDKGNVIGSPTTTFCETENCIITSDKAVYSSGTSNFSLFRLMTNPRLTDLSGYTLGSQKPTSITVEWKTPVLISKVNYALRDAKWDSHTTTSDVLLKAYDENNNLIHEYILNKDAELMDGGMDLATPELGGALILSLIKHNSSILTLLGSSWFDTLLTEPLTQENFKEYGMEDLSIISESSIQELDGNIEILTWTDSEDKVLLEAETDDFTPLSLMSGDIIEVQTWSDADPLEKKLELTSDAYRPLDYILSEDPDAKLVLNYDDTPTVTYNMFGGFIRYLVSFDNKVTWKTFKDSTWSNITLNNITDYGMTKDELNAITTLQWEEVYVDGTIHFAIELTSYQDAVSPIVNNIGVLLPQVAGRTRVKFAFSYDNRTSWWVVENDVWTFLNNLGQLSTRGMEKDVVESISSSLWRDLIWASGNNTLDVAVLLISHDASVSPQVDYISFTYTTIPESYEGDSVTVPTPSDELHRYVWNSVLTEYELKFVEGLLFQDTEDNSYYSTHTGLILKYLEMPPMYTGQVSELVPIVLENTFDVVASDIYLTSDVNLLPAGAEIRFSFTEVPFTESEFLYIESLAPNETRTFYMRLDTVYGNGGMGTFDIKVKGSIPFTPYN